MPTPTIRLTGILTDPMNDAPDVGALLRFTMLTNTGSSLRTSISEMTIDETGAYDITLSYGQVQIEYKTDFKTEKFTVLGIVNINAETAATTIPELVVSSTPPTDENVITFQLLLAQTQSAKTSAENSAAAALASKNAASGSEASVASNAAIASNAATSATASKNSATTSATSASTSASTAITKAAESSASASSANASKIAAAASAVSASESEAIAVARATAANLSKLAAGVSEVNAKASETASKTSETNAGTSASSAASSATTATNRATAATGSASAAASSETVALAQAGIATTKAGEASTSATNAASSNNAAGVSATVANAQAAIATTQAGIATAKATAATNSASAALSSANQAQTIVDGLPAATDNEIARVVSTGTTEVGKVNTEGNARVAAVIAEGNSQTTRVVSAGNTQVFNIETTGAEQEALSGEQAVIATNAATSATTSATAANSSKVAAGISETNALASKNAAEVSATNALASASSATASATSATDSATAANSSKTTAVTSAATATTKASEASTSATNAAASMVLAEAAATSLEVVKAGRNQAQFEANRAQNNEEFAASGFVHFGKHIEAAGLYTPVNQGVYTVLSASFTNLLLMGTNFTGKKGTSKTDYAVMNIAGVTFFANLQNNADAYTKTVIKFPSAPDGKVTYNKSTGAIVTYETTSAAFAAASVSTGGVYNTEVVTERTDMWGFEAFLEEVSLANPYIYPNGLIQSQATTMDGIATSVSARPVTYYAVFEGDTASKGKGLNFFALSDANKKKVLANHKNKLYYLDDGRLVQWRLRQRTIAGAGNGDWSQVDSPIKNALRFDPNNLIKAQGMLDVALPPSPVWNTNTYFGTSTNTYGGSEIGVFTSMVGETTAGINGECYFLVCGTVPRLNTGFYHPSYNPFGASSWLQQNVNWFSWSSSYASSVNSKQKCFLFTTDSGVAEATGSLANGHSGRPDGRYYDVIYASGQGGVCRDMRYSANGVDLVDFYEADLRVKNGEYRGFEKLVFSKVFQTQTLYANDGTVNFTNGTPSEIKTGDTIVSLSGVRSRIESVAPNAIYTINNNGVGVNEPIIIERQLSSSVGGSFLQTDVIGNPANILATPALANGWQGSWLPWIPDNTPSPSQVRKALKDMGQVDSGNNGSSWLSSGWRLGEATNADNTGGAVPDNLVVIRYYQAFAKQTEPAFNTKVYGGNFGVGEVYISALANTGYGPLLAESILGLTLKSNVDAGVGTYGVTRKQVSQTYELLPYVGYEPKHVSVDLPAPSNNSPAFKALNYSTETSGQAGINYAATELKWGGLDWGDDSKVHIVNNESTLVDLNGATVKVVTHKLKEPIGWIKNKI